LRLAGGADPCSTPFVLAPEPLAPGRVSNRGHYHAERGHLEGVRRIEKRIRAARHRAGGCVDHAGGEDARDDGTSHRAGAVAAPFRDTPAHLAGINGCPGAVATSPVRVNARGEPTLRTTVVHPVPSAHRTAIVNSMHDTAVALPCPAVPVAVARVRRRMPSVPLAPTSAGVSVPPVRLSVVPVPRSLLPVGSTLSLVVDRVPPLSLHTSMAPVSHHRGTSPALRHVSFQWCTIWHTLCVRASRPTAGRETRRTVVSHRCRAAPDHRSAEG
jgi:hypothetical protein